MSCYIPRDFLATMKAFRFAVKTVMLQQTEILHTLIVPAVLTTCAYVDVHHKTVNE